jgi:tetratricopeptide (TPR) repeat protein
MSGYLALNRLDEAKTTYGQASERKLNRPTFHTTLYEIAFLRNDAAGMQQQVAWSLDKPGVEGELLDMEANTAAYSGRLREAREFSRRAVASAQHAEEKEAASGYVASRALVEAVFGNVTEARQQAATALSLSTGRDAQFIAMLALGFAGDTVRTETTVTELANRLPEDTLVQFNYLPTIHAQFAVDRGDASRAIEALQSAAPHELGARFSRSFGPAMYPIYVRGEAYLAAHQGSEAAVEFQKILDHRGIVLNEPIGALAHLGLARAYVLQGDSMNARAAYKDFLTLWKDADPNIPVLIAAIAEYAKLN